MVLKQRYHAHQGGGRAPSPRSRMPPSSGGGVRSSSLGSSMGSVSSSMSLPMGDGRVSPRSQSLLQQSAMLNKRRSASSISGTFGRLKLETPLSRNKQSMRSSSLRDSTSTSTSEPSPEQKRQLSPTFFQQSPSPQAAQSGGGRRFFGGGRAASSSPRSSQRQSSTGAAATYGSTDYLRNSPKRSSSSFAAAASSSSWQSWRGTLRTVALTAFALLAGGKLYRSALHELATRESQLIQLKNDFHVLHGKIRDTEDALKLSQSSNHDLEVRSAKLLKDEKKLRTQLEEAKRAGELGEELLGPGKDLDGLDREEANELVARRQKAMRGRIVALQTQIQTISRREAEERFGPGPHRAIFTVLTEHAGSNSKTRSPIKKAEKPATFTIELATLSQMPHSVHLFLQMIDHGLWDDTIFLHTAHHVLQAAPLSYPSGESKRALFDESDLAHLSFQEYSDDYPHDKYTIGFGGRPGGPDFFINTQNNGDYHGPGGQDHHDLHEEADPCFGKVVSGMAVVDKLHRRSVAMVGTDGEGWEGDDIPITTIVSVKWEGGGGVKQEKVQEQEEKKKTVLPNPKKKQQ